MTPAARAPAEASRLHAVDALRALALLGILAVNIWFFAHPAQLETGMRTHQPETPGDQLVSFAVTLVFEAKSYVVFSFLFGLSFVLQWASAHRAGASEVRRSVRRFITLGALGVLHGIFLFVGDILLAYAILGFALLGMRRISSRRALIIAAALYAAVSLFLFGMAGAVLLAEGTPGFDEVMPAPGDADAAVSAYTGGLGSYLGFQFSAYAVVAPSILFGQGFMALAAFLVGLVVGRSRVLERIISREVPTGRLVTVMLGSLAVGLVFSTAAAWLLWGAPGAVSATSGGADMGTSLLASALVLTGGPVQSLSYVIAALLVLRSPTFTWLTRMLAPAGRMSLTNYLGQSVVLTGIFSALGLGLAGQLQAHQVGLIVVVLWIAQLILSGLWMRRFRTGPLEGPLRAITYGRTGTAAR